MKYLTTAFAILWIHALFSQGNADLYLGVLETKWSENEFIVPADSFTIKKQRILFRFDGDDWYSLENDIGDTAVYPQQMHWYIAFDGQLLGEFNSIKAPIKFESHPWTYPRDAHHIPQENNLPTIGKPTAEFTGWASSKLPRPLVTVSDSNYTDLEKWKPYVPEIEERNPLQSVVIKHTSIFEMGLYDSTLTDVIIEAHTAFGKSYASINSDKLLQLGFIDTINGERYIYNMIWFYKSAQGEVIDLSKAIDFPWLGSGDAERSTLSLVDAGDYDRDGFTDVLFWISRYNGDGYALFYNNFSKFVTFEWTYH